MQISYLSRNNGYQRCGQDKCFFKFSHGVFNFRSISVVDSISVMCKYNLMQFFFYKCEAIQNPLHRPKVSCLQRLQSKSFKFHPKIVGFENPNFIFS